MSFLFVGLGNPGDKYHGTRHNVGFMLLDYFADRLGLLFGETRWKGLLAKQRVWGEQVFFVKPQTFMNRSGTTVGGVLRYYDIPLDRTLVVHDDLDMDVGRIKLVRGGGAGGHNGIRSIVDSVGASDFYRLKIGIGRPGNSDVHPDMPVDKFVLADFSPTESDIINKRIELLEDGISLLVRGDVGKAMSNLNCLK